MPRMAGNHSLYDKQTVAGGCPWPVLGNEVPELGSQRIPVDNSPSNHLMGPMPEKSADLKLVNRTHFLARGIQTSDFEGGMTVSGPPKSLMTRRPAAAVSSS